MEFTFGLLIGIFLCAWIANKILMNALIKHKSMATEQSEFQLLEAKVEEINGQFFVWDVKDNSFLAQGFSAKEILDKLDLRYQTLKVEIKVVQGEKDALKKLKASIQPD